MNCTYAENKFINMSEIVICCICLTETDDDLLGLFDKCVKSEKCWWNILFDVIGVDAYSIKDDMIPSASKICTPCSNRLMESYEFQKLCQRNWDKLISMTNEFMWSEEVKPPVFSKYTCNDCQKSFRFECNLKIHMDVNHTYYGLNSNSLDGMPEKAIKSEFESRTCAKQIEVWLEEQKDEIDEVKLFKVDDCPETNPIEDLFDKDKTRTKGKRKSIKRDCIKVETSRRRRKSKVFIEEKHFECSECSDVFASSKMLKSHIQIAHFSTSPPKRKKREKSTEPRLCPICGKSFNAKNENGFQKHMFHHDPSIGKIKYYQCELCDRKFLGKRSLEEHMNFHLNIRPYTCEVETCKKSFIYEQSYKNHTKLHLGKDFECDICRKQFITSTNLKYHLTRVHQGVKKYACDQCDKSYFTLQHLKVHQLSHLEKKAYTCDVCNRGITHYASLLSHMLLHTGKPFQCDHCNMAFTHRWRFGKHLAERHSISEIPKKYARKMAEKLVSNVKEERVDENTVDK